MPKNCMHNPDCINSPALKSLTTLSLLFIFFLIHSFSLSPSVSALRYLPLASIFVLSLTSLSVSLPLPLVVLVCWRISTSFCLPRSSPAFHGSRSRATSIVASICFSAFSLLGFMLRFSLQLNITAMTYLPPGLQWYHEEADCRRLFCWDFRSCWVYKACLARSKLFVSENGSL